MRHWCLSTGDSCVEALIHTQGVFYPWTHLMATLILVATITINSDKVHCWLYIIGVQPLCLSSFHILWTAMRWGMVICGKICHYCSGLYNLRERLFQNKKKVFSHLHAEYFIISYNCVKLQVTLSRQADQGPVSWKARKLFSPKGKFWSQNLLNSTTVHSSKTSQFCFVNWYFYYIIFKIIGTLILNANKTNTKQLSGPKNLSGLSRNRPQLGIRH